MVSEMYIATATEPGDPTKANEDWIFAGEQLIVVLDGATARTDTGCRHGIAWFAAKLGSAIASLATDPTLPLSNVLWHAIVATADQHRECDLTHPGTPCAALTIVRRSSDAIEYLVLGDVTLVLDIAQGVEAITDDRVDKTAREERLEAARLPFGSEAKQAALLKMKHAELAVRNRADGYWVAAADPTVVSHAISGTVALQELRRLAVLTDGAARAVVPFGLLDWEGVLKLIDEQSPTELVKRVRAIEAADPTGERWPRNKSSDDATVVYYQLSGRR